RLPVPEVAHLRGGDPRAAARRQVQTLPGPGRCKRRPGIPFGDRGVERLSTGDQLHAENSNDYSRRNGIAVAHSETPSRLEGAETAPKTAADLASANADRSHDAGCQLCGRSRRFDSGEDVAEATEAPILIAHCGIAVDRVAQPDQLGLAGDPIDFGVDEVEDLSMDAHCRIPRASSSSL